MKLIVLIVLAVLVLLFLVPSIGERCPKCGSRHTRKFKSEKGVKKYICGECLEILEDYGE